MRTLHLDLYSSSIYWTNLLLLCHSYLEGQQESVSLQVCE